MKTDALALVSSNICGIPCVIKVVTYIVEPGNYSYNAASDYDYYGYTEIEYEVLDRKGYSAEWLAKKVTDEINTRIEGEIVEYFRKQNEIAAYLSDYG